MAKHGNIPIGTRATAEVRRLLEQIGRARQQLETYLAGVRSQITVPDDWVYDFREMAFVPPPGSAAPEESAEAPKE